MSRKAIVFGSEFIALKAARGAVIVSTLGLIFHASFVVPYSQSAKRNAEESKMKC